jgi:hypothetical protein
VGHVCSPWIAAARHDSDAKVAGAAPSALEGLTVNWRLALPPLMQEVMDKKASVSPGTDTNGG